MAQYDDLAFTSQHEWVRVDPPQGGGGMTATVGITAYAADKLGDVVFVDLPDAGETITTGAVVGEIESTKSVGEIFAPVDGVVIEKNSAVIEAPELVNSDPFGAGWLIRVDFTRLPTLLSYQEYQTLIDEQDSTY